MLTVKVVVFVCVQRSDWCKLVKKAPCPQERMKVYLYAYVHVCVYMCTSNMYIICMYEVYIYTMYMYIYLHKQRHQSDQSESKWFNRFKPGRQREAGPTETNHCLHSGVD